MNTNFRILLEVLENISKLTYGLLQNLKISGRELLKKFANSRYDGFCRNSKDLLETSKVLSFMLFEFSEKFYVSF
ncbi:hypothetical protein LEP1GSC046_2782 [Leptospira kirschneri serovar Bim str. 1051]|nr:hypothetical protein LEP1GSC042_0457 [Leptospira kirschneri serovar Bim str. PUO 1247]EMN06128.1 hypothetical protein LEP1GSC046_2782 [Leptospira kirschneri serovar Bim str. 1051]EMN26513.1 hypothetical protein LEP1GSC065_0659 [Leptospira kirschneri serovar Sokoine str. RM1]EMO78915.1 hypothetical protein LEP1GSC126_3123 [Leptospira kirschneri str. 200801774]